jgi:hypothetical protein
MTMNESKTSKIRILALEVRSSGFGFATFTGADLLVDWGTSSATAADRLAFTQAMASLLDEVKPSVVVIGSSGRRAALMTVQAVSKAAHLRKLTVQRISRQQISDTFADRNQNKHQIGIAIGERFPELAVYAPPKRKPWNSEDYRTRIFDAVASGIAYFSSNAPRDGPRA